MSTKITIRKDQIGKYAHDNAFGQHYLVISPNGDWRVTWADSNRQWNPWGENDYVVSIPAVFPDGSGEECDLAQ